MSGPRRVSRSIGAVLAGLATVFVGLVFSIAGAALRQMQLRSPALGEVA